MKLYSFNRRKIYFMCIALVMAAVLLMGRLAYLMVAKADYYDSAATQLHERERSIKAPRGKIYDRNGNILADNKAVCSVSVIHSQIEDEEEVIRVLNEHLDKAEADIRKKVKKVSSRELIAANIDKTTGDAIRELPELRLTRTIKGIILMEVLLPRSLDSQDLTIRVLSVLRYGIMRYWQEKMAASVQ